MMCFPTAPWRTTTPGQTTGCSPPVARLTPDEFTAKRTGFFPSLRATLNHILIIDHFYVDAMEGGTLGPAALADPGALRDGCRAEGSPGRGRPALAQDRRSARRRRSAAHRLRASRHLHPARADGPLAAASVPARRPSSRAGPRHALSGTSVSPPQLDEFFSRR